MANIRASYRREHGETSSQKATILRPAHVQKFESFINRKLDNLGPENEAWQVFEKAPSGADYAFKLIEGDGNLVFFGATRKVMPTGDCRVWISEFYKEINADQVEEPEEALESEAA